MLLHFGAVDQTATVFVNGVEMLTHVGGFTPFSLDISKALEGDSALKSVTVFLAAMLNDYADEQGWAERWTPRSVGRKFGISGVPTNEIMQLVVRSLTPAGKMSESDTPEAQEDPGNPGN